MEETSQEIRAYEHHRTARLGYTSVERSQSHVAEFLVIRSPASEYILQGPALTERDLYSLIHFKLLFSSAE